MSLYITQLQEPIMAATGEQRCLKLMFVIARAQSPYGPSPAVRSLLKQGYTNSNRVGAVVSLPG